MAAGDPYFDCTNNSKINLETMFAMLVVQDDAGNPCFKVCGDVVVGGPAPAQGNPDIDQFTDAAGATASGIKSVTFAWTGAAEIDGILFPNDDLSPISFSDENGLDPMTWDVTEATTGTVGGDTITILTVA